MICRFALLLALVLVDSACSRGPQVHVAEAQRKTERPGLEAEVPALRWVPADAELVVVADSVAQLLVVVRAIVRNNVLPRLSEHSDWEAWGVDLKAPVSLYGKGGEFTILLPTLASPVLGNKLAHLFPNHRKQEYRSYELARAQSAGLELSWIQVEGHVLVHIAASDSLAWVDAIHQSYQGQGYSASPEATRAKQEAIGAIWGSVRFFPVLQQLLGQELSCANFLLGVDALAFSGEMSEEAASHRISLVLSNAQAATLHELQSVSPSPGMQLLRETSGLFASVALDLEKTAVALHSAECPELAELLHIPFQRAGWSPMPVAMHGAGSRFDPGSLSGKLAVELTLHNARFFRRQLNQIPMRSLFESTLQVQGQRARRLSIPTMSPLYYQLQAKALVFATQRKLLASLLAATPVSSAGTNMELISAGIRPQQLPQSGALLRSLIPDMFQREIAKAMLARISFARIDLALEQNELSLDVKLLAREGQSLLW